MKHLGNIYHIDEIEKLDNGQGLDVMTYCGGYNCRHMWLPATKEEYDKSRT